MVWGWVSLFYQLSMVHVVTQSMKDYLNILLANYRALSLSPSKTGREDDMGGIIIGITFDLF